MVPEIRKSDFNTNGCLMDFRAGTGGDEGFYWAEELVEYYINYVNNKGFKV